ncbi:hypothetical protein SDRG_03539 [Saprolegnia diclina VS20]|uniref:Ciliary BBSome complex subunit 2 middle region domain-containing protein n=1 Tax=Saprolegnia diclina (strain VS20) TaxID=1156394 RepID=T0QML0_SAPDV|nr:hypothetical protein SDRG_03539 [Saprolegnia diclina VS20]EQC39334.1 hypothetical protein SDRG_03539 [Saprolegnia diclina VS20]|eukprot:XP_008607395.1 hypothetical protein SDRG_03539 [Saprolegnia diclina VS20]
MSLQLSHAELFKVAPISSRQSLKLLPFSLKKKKQKLVVGDDSGVVSSFQMKKGDPVAIYKSVPQTNAITSINLGLYKGTTDKAYVSSGQQVLGYTKKGKEFFKFQSNLSETINRVFTYDTHLWTATDYIYNQFENGQDKHFYMCQDRINDMLLLHENDELVPVLACQDKYIRFIQGSEPLAKKSVPGACTTLTKHTLKKAPSQILYGSANGAFGAVQWNNQKVKTIWKTDGGALGDSNAHGPAAITALASFDINKDDSNEIIVGRDDGRIEVYSVDASGGITKEFESVEQESVRAFQTGVLSTPGFDEIVFCTYSGRVLSLTSEPLDQPDTDDVYGRSRGTVQRETRIVKLRKEIAQLEEKVTKERDRMARKSASEKEACLPVVEEVPVNCKCALNVAEQTYDLSVEIPVPIATVVLHSSVPLDLLDTVNNQAILCRSPPDVSTNSHVLATYRCQEFTNRLEFRVRTLEGQYGEIELTVLADTVPRCAQVVKQFIKPLSLHHRINIVESTELDEATMNSLHLTGDFSLLQVHEWVSYCLPEVPLRLQDDDIKMYFRNTFFGNVLVCEYRKGDAQFSSASISTIAILKEVITKEATTRKIGLDISFDIKPSSIPFLLNLLRPKLDWKQMIASQVKILDGIKELQMHEADHTLWMSPEYQSVLKDADTILDEFKARPRALNYLAGVLTDLYVDVCKFRGVNPKPQIPQLYLLLDQYSFDALVAFFMQHH